MGIRNLRAVALPYLARLKGRHLRIGSGTKVAMSARLDPGAGRIVTGRNCEFHHGAILAAGDGSIEIGDNVSVQHYSLLYGTGDLRIGNDVRIAGQVMIVPFNHRFEDPDALIRKQGLDRRPITIGHDVWIGGGAKILAGSVVADGCVIAANAVVRGATEPYSIYGGIPARKIGTRRP